MSSQYPMMDFRLFVDLLGDCKEERSFDEMLPASPIVSPEPTVMPLSTRIVYAVHDVFTALTRPVKLSRVRSITLRQDLQERIITTMLVYFPEKRKESPH